MDEEMKKDDINGINKVFILLTPFQTMMAKNLFENDLNLETTLILYNEYVDVEEYTSNKCKIGNIQVSNGKNKLYSVSNLIELRTKVKSIKNEIEKILDSCCFQARVDVFIGSEKDLSSQFFIRQLNYNKKLNELIAIEEGVGYYKKQNNFKNVLFRCLYKSFSKVFLGERINYVFTLGVDKRINKVYARLPELLPHRKEKTKYIKVQSFDKSLKKQESIQTINDKNILIFTFPSQDHDRDNLKLGSLELILEAYSDYKISIKPHPRENIDYLETIKNEFNFNLLDKRITAEELNYFKYEKIVNFYSSVVIDLINSGYPQKNILTIGFNRTTNISFFQETNYKYVGDLKSFLNEN